MPRGPSPVHCADTVALRELPSACGMGREDTSPLLENKDLAIADIYVPAKRRRTLKQATVEALAESILEDGLKVPILVREDGKRYVLVEGLHRLEACRALGEDVIACTMVQARS